MAGGGRSTARLRHPLSQLGLFRFAFLQNFPQALTSLSSHASRLYVILHAPGSPSSHAAAMALNLKAPPPALSAGREAIEKAFNLTFHRRRCAESSAPTPQQSRADGAVAGPATRLGYLQ
jgi:hypothetical protein